MQIAITSQNRRSITQHAGKCRNFWVYTLPAVAAEAPQRRLVELPLEASFHATQGALPPELADIDVLISASIGGTLWQRLLEHGITPVITEETDIDAAIAQFVATGASAERSEEAQRACSHGHRDGHGHSAHEGHRGPDHGHGKPQAEGDDAHKHGHRHGPGCRHS
jgi:predicted Fe-Mo cluster-binding NifX family protein